MARPHCVFALEYARQHASGPDSVVPLSMVCRVEVALWRRFSHGGGLLSVMGSVSLVFSIDAGMCLGGDFLCRRRLLAVAACLRSSSFA